MQDFWKKYSYMPLKTYLVTKNTKQMQQLKAEEPPESYGTLFLMISWLEPEKL